MLKPQDYESQNVRQNIRSGIYQINNHEKSCKRTFTIYLFILIGFLIMSEVIMNFHCMKHEILLLILDTTFYMGLLIIVIFEITILCQKMKKKNKKNLRSRYRFRLLLIMYLGLVFIILVCLIIHTVFQLYFSFTDMENKFFFLDCLFQENIFLFYFILQLNVSHLYSQFKLFLKLIGHQNHLENQVVKLYQQKVWTIRFYSIQFSFI